MIRASLILMMVLLTGCSASLTKPEPSAGLTAPVLPTLTDQQRASCPPLDLLEDKSRGELASKDAQAAFQYAACQRKHQNVVSMFDEVVAAVNRYVEELRQKALPATQEKKR